jgi:hypothetical protein
MTKVQRFVLVALFALLVASASAGAQSGGATSSGVLSSGAALQGSQSGVVTTAKKTGNKRSMIADAGARGAPRLCFQPGVGWQSVPLSTVGGAGDTSESRSSGGTVVKQSTLSSTPKSAYAQPSGASHATNTACSESSPSAAASGVSVDSHAQSMTSINSTGMNTGAQDWLGANSAINPASTGASQGGTAGLSSMAAGRTSVVGARTNGLKKRTYTSSIELRRMMRSAPDLQTRMKLQREQETLTKKSTKSSYHSTNERSIQEQQTGKQRDSKASKVAKKMSRHSL